jgi:D-glycero-alpha-D-manno-heptose-7-phosphate kinase
MTPSHSREAQPLRIINSVAPIRVCDNGGWTDTWFAEYGKIFNIGVYPYAEVQMRVFPLDTQKHRIVIHAENYGERYVRHLANDWDRHPLLEAAIERMGVPDDVSIQLSIHSEAPAGASTGTSAAVTVALIGALDQLTPGRLTPHEVAYIAQSIETDMLKQQCGIQDQLCSAFGGINFIEMHRYPHASVSQIQVPNSIWWELERRLVLVFLGKSHHSSHVHENVIRHLEDVGPTAKQLEALRATAEPSRDAVYAGDFAALGIAMIQNTEGQRNLHPDLVSADAQRVIDIAQAHGAVGWKVNGAGGDGGSLTILCSESSHSKRTMINEIEEESPLFQNIPIYLSRFGLRIWETYTSATAQVSLRS